MVKEMNRKKVLIIVMFITGLLGIFLISYNYVLSKVRLTFESVNMQLYGNNEPEKVDKETPKEEEIINETIAEEKKESIIEPVSYFGYIEIPKINLKQGLVPTDSKDNNVNKNIQTIVPSDYPDVNGGNLILAAHSGTSSISYFKNLYQLANGDVVHILYNNQKYIYNIVNIYTVPKNGEVAIYRNTSKTTLTLITCTRGDDTTQTVYICELSGKEGI